MATKAWVLGGVVGGMGLAATMALAIVRIFLMLSIEAVLIRLVAPNWRASPWQKSRGMGRKTGWPKTADQPTMHPGC